MNRTTPQRIRIIDENPFDMLIKEQPRTIDKLIDHPRRNRLSGWSYYLLAIRPRCWGLLNDRGPARVQFGRRYGIWWGLLRLCVRENLLAQVLDDHAADLLRC